MSAHDPAGQATTADIVNEMRVLDALERDLDQLEARFYAKMSAMIMAGKVVQAALKEQDDEGAPSADASRSRLSNIATAARQAMRDWMISGGTTTDLYATADAIGRHWARTDTQCAELLAQAALTARQVFQAAQAAEALDTMWLARASAPALPPTGAR